MAASGGALIGMGLQIPFLILAWITLIAIGMVAKRFKVLEYEDMVLGKFMS